MSVEQILMSGGTLILGLLTGTLTARTSARQERTASAQAGAEEWKGIAAEYKADRAELAKRQDELEARLDTQGELISRQTRRMTRLLDVLEQAVAPLQWIRAGAVPPAPVVDRILDDISHLTTTASEEDPS